MARNIFASPFETGMDAFDRSFDRTQAIMDQRTRRKAGQRLASGDRMGAASEFATSGMIPEARQMQADQQVEDDRGYQRERQGQEDQRAETQRRVEALTKVAQALQSVPPGQRKAALAQAYPIFQHVGLDTGMFDGLTEDQLSDQSLQMFAGELERQWQGINLGSGGFGAFNNRTGEFQTIREPDPRPVIIGNGATAIDPETGEVVARNPKTFAPPRPSGGGQGLRNISTEELIKAVRGY